MSGLLALLDDIATLAKLTMSTLDDTASMAVKASAKVSAAAVDDVAATPQYVTGITAEREIPIIRRIARGSLINKLAIILPAALLLNWLAPWMLPIALAIGGSYLCFEGGEKVWHAASHRFRHAPSHSGISDAEASPSASSSPDPGSPESQPEAEAASELGKAEDGIVRQATTTDFVLSTEIMLLALAEVQQESSTQRVIVLILIAALMTFAVYGLVAALIKLDDLGLHMAHHGRTGASRRAGRGIVTAAPTIFSILGVVGTVAMLWVGGQILAHNLAELGLDAPHHLVVHLAEPAEHASAVLHWIVETGLYCVWGLLIGLILTGLVTAVRALIHLIRGSRR